MNKFLRYSLSLVLAFVANVALMAAEPYKVLTFPDDNKDNNKVGSYSKTWEAKMGEDVWTIENFNNNNWNGWSYIKCGSKNGESVATITSPVCNEAVEYVVITFDKITASLVKSLRIEAETDGGGSTAVGYYTNNPKLKVGDLVSKIDDVKVGSNINIIVSCDKGSANGFVQISKIALYKKGDKPSVTPSVDISNTAETAYTVSKAKELIDAGEGLGTQVYVKGIVSQAPTSLNETYGSLTYYISEDGKAENEFQIYSGLNIGGEKFTSADQIKVGDEVVVFGTLKKYNNNYEMDYNNQLVSIKSTSTSISTITTDTAAENAPAFNLAGQKVGKAYKGVVIKGGKKFIQK